MSIRQFWLENAILTPPPVICKPIFLPNSLVTHLLTNKKLSSVKQKHIEGDLITNMQACFHTLIVPLIYPLFMPGRPNYSKSNGHFLEPIIDMPGVYILSMLVNPDFEFTNCMYEILRLESYEIKGELVDWENTTSESELKRWFVYLFGEDHRYPPGDGLYLPALAKVIDKQIELEMRGLDQLNVKKIVYTWDPPQIFAQCIDYRVLDKLWADAIAAHKSSKITKIVFNDFKNKEIVGYLRSKLPLVSVVSRAQFYQEPPNASCVCLLHSNSDAFGQHILSQPSSTSLEGLIGTHSSAVGSTSQMNRASIWEC